MMAGHKQQLVDVLQGLDASGDYAQGVIDVLRLLGLLRIDQDSAAPTGDVARLLIAHLAELAGEGSTLHFDWNDLDAEGLRGVDVLRAFEAGRNSAAPIRSVVVAQSVIKARLGSGDCYLMQYDAHGGQYQPLGGKVDPTDASIEYALRREIMEELAFSEAVTEADCTLSPLRLDWRTTKISATYGVLTDYVFHFYHATDVRFPIAITEETRWLSRGEIERGRADDGRAISSIYVEALGWAVLDALAISAAAG